MDYQDIEYKLVDFLNKNYYSENAPATNRMLHSQQVMLITGLIAKSKAIPESEQNRLLCMTSGLVHDIGHVPGAHATERILADYDGFFSHEVNGQKVDIPSYLIKAGDVISVRENKLDNKTIKENVEANKTRPIPEWLEKDNNKLQVKVLRLAAREDVDIPVEEHLIVELYSR